MAGQRYISQTSDVDYFRVTPTGSRLSARVNVASFGPNLDARLELRDSLGNLITSTDTTGDPNPLVNLEASLMANVTPGRTYYIVVGSSGRYGDVGSYSLTVAETGPLVLSTEPSAYHIRVNFDKPVDPTTMIANLNVRVLNAAGIGRSVTVTPVAGTNNRSFIVSFTPSLRGGYRLVLSPTIRDAEGRFMDQDGDFAQGEPSDGFVVEDFAGARVQSHDLVGWTRIRVRFSEEIDPRTFTVADVTISPRVDFVLGAGQARLPIVIRDVVAVSPLNRTAGAAGALTTTFEIVVDNLPRNGSRITLGPDIRDRYGNWMNQDGDVVNGEAAQDRFQDVVMITPLMQRNFDLTRRLEAIDFDRLGRLNNLGGRLPVAFAGPQPEPPVRRDLVFAGPQPEPPGAPPSLARMPRGQQLLASIDRGLADYLRYDLETSFADFDWLG